MTTRAAAEQTSSVTYIDVDGTPLHPPTGLRDVCLDDLEESLATPQLPLNGTMSVQSLRPVWSTGIVTGTVILLTGLLMIALTKGLAAVIFWPLGAFAAIIGTTVLGTTLAARRTARRLSRGLGFR